MGKKTKQQKPAPAPEPLFHEMLGRQLADKFMAILDEHDNKPQITRYFAEPQKNSIQIVRRTSEESSSSDSTMHEIISATDLAVTISKASLVRQKDSKHKPRTQFTLDDLNSAQTIEELLSYYGRMTHMGVRDHSYLYFLNQSRSGVISYRLCGKVAVISGDPVCPVWLYQELLKEFAKYCKSNGWQWCMNGASNDMATVAKELSWSTIAIARERVINVQTNPVLTGSEGKRIRTQCKQTMKSGTQLGVYSPQHHRDLHIERALTQIYEDWRADRNESTGPQAYVTIFDMFALPRLMTFIYSYTDDGTITGFAALRQMKSAYHIDPCITIPTAGRGTVDLLLIASMALLREAGVERLCLGVEPLDQLGEVTGMSQMLERLTRKTHALVAAELPLGGKKGFNDRFRPDDSLEEPLYLIYPNSPSVRQQVAMAHFSNVQLHKAFKQRYQREVEQKIRHWRRKDASPPPSEAGSASEEAAATTTTAAAVVEPSAA